MVEDEMVGRGRAGRPNLGRRQENADFTGLVLHRGSRRHRRRPHGGDRHHCTSATSQRETGRREGGEEGGGPTGR